MNHNEQTSSAVVPVILSGGSGTRLWPMSRQLYPKQFIPLVGSESLFQATIERVAGLKDVQPVRVVCNNEHRFMAAEQLREMGMGDGQIILEPVGRNTAPAIAVAAFEVADTLGEGILLVLPADHLIRRVDVFHQAVAHGAVAARAGHLVTFGVVPNRPETGYGYIRRGQGLDLAGEDLAVYRVEAFAEKPDLERARAYLESGDYLWNSGMFMFQAARYLEELERHAPQIYEVAGEAYSNRSKDLDFIRLDPEAFAASPSDSIDYAVMEKTASAAVIPLDAGWSDVGSWHSLWESEDQDEDGNVVVGDVIGEQNRGCYLHSNYRLLGAIGLQDMVVVETADAVLVAPQGRSQDVRMVVDRLKAERRDEAVLHRRVYRPWGSYEVVDVADRFLVNRITVKPGHSLSLQMHHHRAEHWVVVKGTAKVTRDGETFMLTENESTFIPVGARHRLENPGKIPLEMIEVQSGSYLGDDDIVRFEDRYGR